METELDFRQWNVVSLGAGVQSSTMALMAAHGEITPMPDFAVFADTQDELPEVYQWLDQLEAKLPYPVMRTTKGKLSDSFTQMKVTEDGRTYSQTNVPLYTLGEDGSKGRVPHRSCTRDYKIRPIQKQLRKTCGVRYGEKRPVVVSWVGISLDEVQRAKPSRDAWNPVRWPLLELRMTRARCLQWMEQHGYPRPPRSACYYCPFHSNAEWRRIQTEFPEWFEKAVAIEETVQELRQQSRNFSAMPFLHPSCQPLGQIDFRSDVERGQMTLWDDECEGMCGV